VDGSQTLWVAGRLGLGTTQDAREVFPGTGIGLARFSLQGETLAARSYPGGGPDTLSDMASRDGGGVFITGSAYEQMRVGGIDVDSAGLQDVYLASIGTDLRASWVKHWGAGASDTGSSVVRNPDTGQLYLTGTYVTEVDFGGGPLPAGQYSDLVFASYDAQGNHQFSYGFRSGGNDGAVARLGPDGHIYLLGRFRDEIDLGGGPIGPQPEKSFYLASFDGAGNHRWSRDFGGPGYSVPSAFAVGPDGALFVAARFQDRLDLGGGTMNQQDGGSFVARFDAEGALQWAVQLAARVEALEVGAARNLYVAGWIEQATQIGEARLSHKGGADALVAAFDGANGSVRWARALGGDRFDLAQDLAVDDRGRIYVAGRFSETVDFGPAEHTTAGQEPGSNPDGFILQLLP
jgi:hypothetical protein